MRRFAAALTVALAMLIAAACGGAERSDSAATAIDVFGPYQGNDADRFSEVLRGFERQTGIDVRYAGSSDFVSDLRERAADPRSAPDVAVVPQAGVVRELADQDLVLPLGDRLTAAVRENYPTGVDLGAVDETLVAIPFRVTVKSLVWYSPRVFAEQGWSPPDTLTGLRELVEEIDRTTDYAPWCFSISAGSATGWAATDWTEDLVLRRSGAAVYRRWALGDTDFSDPDIAAAFEEFRDLVLAQGRTFGGVDRIVGTLVSDAVDPLFTDPPGCALFKQADFAVGWMPPGTEVGPDGDVDFFVLPGSTAGSTPPLVVGADQIVHFRRSPGISRLMEYLASPEAAAVWARRGDFISPNAKIDDAAYPRDHLRRIRRALVEGDRPVYDASDQMPPEIGSGLLWQLITLWVGGSIEYEQLAAVIDAERSTLSRSPDLPGTDAPPD